METKLICPGCGKQQDRISNTCVYHKKHRSLWRKEYSSRPDVKAHKKQYMLDYLAKPENKERSRVVEKRYKHKPENQARSKLIRKAYLSIPENRTKTNKQRAINHQNVKMRVLKHYSHSEVPYCVCCGETETSFLTLGHSNGDGARHRKKLGNTGRGPGVYRWIVREGYPDDLGLEVLCWNCQWGRYLNNNICPHKIR